MFYSTLQESAVIGIEEGASPSLLKDYQFRKGEMEMGFREVLDNLEEKQKNNIEIPEDILKELPRMCRNAIDILMKYPEGIYSKQFQKELKTRWIAQSINTRQEFLAQNGWEVYVQKNVRGTEGFWQLRKIKPKNKKSNDEENNNAIRIGDTVWFIMCKFDKEHIRDDYLVFNPKDMELAFTLLENKEAITRAESMGCFTSNREAIKALSSRTIEMFK